MPKNIRNSNKNVVNVSFPITYDDSGTINLSFHSAAWSSGTSPIVRPASFTLVGNQCTFYCTSVVAPQAGGASDYIHLLAGTIPEQFRPTTMRICTSLTTASSAGTTTLSSIQLPGCNGGCLIYPDGSALFGYQILNNDTLSHFLSLGYSGGFIEFSFTYPIDFN